MEDNYAIKEFTKFFSGHFYTLNGEKREAFEDVLKNMLPETIVKAINMIDADLQNNRINPRFFGLLQVRNYLRRAAMPEKADGTAVPVDCRYCDSSGIFYVPVSYDTDGEPHPWTVTSKFDHFCWVTMRCPCNQYCGAGLASATKEDVRPWCELVEPFLVRSEYFEEIGETVVSRVLFRAEQCAEALMMMRAGLTDHPYFGRLWRTLASRSPHNHNRVMEMVNQC